MEVKGTSPTNTLEFVQQRFGEPGVRRWLDALGPASRELFEGKILASSWYPAATAFTDPVGRMCDLFFAGDAPTGAWQLGRFSAENTLTGVYKVFVRIGSPGFMLERASKVFETFFRPGEVRLIERGRGLAVMRIQGMDEVSELWENRIGGFIEAAAEIAKAPERRVEVVTHGSAAGRIIDYRLTWRE